MSPTVVGLKRKEVPADSGIKVKVSVKVKFSVRVKFKIKIVF